MSWYVNFYLGVQDKDDKIVPLGPYDNEGNLRYVRCTSRSFTTDLHKYFYPITDEMLTDELREEFKEDLDSEFRRYFEYLPLSELPQGDYIKTGYFLLRDINEYLTNKDCFDEFYDMLTPAEYAMRLDNELKFGKPTPIKDDEGYEYTPHSCSEYAYFSYPDYLSVEYEAWLLRNEADILADSYNLDKTGSKVVILKTEG